jgi:endonuclease/exonuclease/phosphatase family metal-dependent hydrolase
MLRRSKSLRSSLPSLSRAVFLRRTQAWTLAVVLGGLAACAPSDAGEVGEVGVADETAVATLDVMAFNVRYGTADDGEDAWPLRRDMFMDVIRAHEPELLGLQEALRSQIDDIHRAIEGYGEVGVGRDDGEEAGEYSSILYDTTRFELLDGGTFWLSDTPDVPGSMSWGNEITRIVSWAHFHDRVGDHPLHVYNMHWDHRSQPSRDSSAIAVLRHIAARASDDPLIVMGDFNAGESNSAFLALLSGDALVDGAPQLRDTFREIHPDATDVGTFHGFRGGVEGDKIDAILVSAEWDVLDATIDRTSRDGRYPSDHYPVTARIIRR